MQPTSIFAMTLETDQNRIYRYNELGATIAERNALFNNCKFATIFRDCDWKGRMEWQVLVGTDTNGGFEHGRFKTRKSAIEFTKGRYPGLEINAQWGNEFRHVQEMNPAIRAA